MLLCSLISCYSSNEEDVMEFKGLKRTTSHKVQDITTSNHCNILNFIASYTAKVLCALKKRNQLFFKDIVHSPRKIFKTSGAISYGCMFKGGATLGKLYNKPLQM